MRAQLPDIRMGYDENGSGLPLVLLHGYPLSRRLWQLQIDLLPDAAHLIAPDLRGHGETDAPPGPYTMDQMADDVAALLDEMGVARPVVVCGLSMGGYVTLAFWRRHRQRVAGLILAATRAGADTAEAQAARDQAAALAQAPGGAAAVVEGLLPKMLAPRAYAENPSLVAAARQVMAGARADGIFGALMAMKHRPDSTGLLAGISQPVLVIHGLEDQLIPPAEAEAMYQRLSHSRLVLAPDAGHLVNLEQPLTFNAEVRNFLQSL
ncbi:MAG: alpha/beta fold hydrolase [Anaerolineales bacterium]|nr:alpha/beta fold hydrolase [Anaerolineales bacterium]